MIDNVRKMISCLLPVRKNPLNQGGNQNLPESRARHLTGTSRERGWTRIQKYEYTQRRTTINSNDAKRKKNWQTKLRERCQLRMITSVKSRPFTLESPWQLSISWNREDNNLLLFLERQQITSSFYFILGATQSKEDSYLL